MPLDFDSFLSFAEHLAVVAIETRRQTENALVRAAKLVEKTAKDEIGHYQDAVGPFSAWAPLADSTLAAHAAVGVGDTPLIVTGELYASISYQVDKENLEAFIGSDSDIMVYQELGTDKIPPRAVMGPAGVRNHEKIEKLLGAAAAEGLLYGSGHHLVELED